MVCKCHFYHQRKSDFISIEIYSKDKRLIRIMLLVTMIFPCYKFIYESKFMNNNRKFGKFTRIFQFTIETDNTNEFCDRANFFNIEILFGKMMNV